MKRQRSAPKPAAGLSFLESLRSGGELLHAGRAKEALPYLRHAFRLNSADVDAAINLGGVYIMLGRYKLARAVLEQAVDRHPFHSKVWINLGAAHLGDLNRSTREGQQQAIAAFEQALRLDPAAPSVNYNLGLIYLHQGNQQEALVHFRRAAAINPLDLDAHNKLEALLAEGADEL